MTSLKKNKVVHWDKKYDSGQGAKRISNAGVPRALLGRNHYACDGNFCKLTQNRNNLLLFILQECIKCINKMYLGEHSIILRKKHVAWGKVMITLKSLLFHFFSYHLCALKLLPIVRIIYFSFRESTTSINLQKFSICFMVLFVCFFISLGANIHEKMYKRLLYNISNFLQTTKPTSY